MLLRRALSSPTHCQLIHPRILSTILLHHHLRHRQDDSDTNNRISVPFSASSSRCYSHKTPTTPNTTLLHHQPNHRNSDGDTKNHSSTPSSTFFSRFFSHKKPTVMSLLHKTPITTTTGIRTEHSLSSQFKDKKYAQLRWDFLKRIYGLISAQSLTVLYISTAMVLRPSLLDHPSSLDFDFVFLLAPSSCFAMYAFEKKYPFNAISLGVFTLTSSFVIGAACALDDGNKVFHAVALSTAAVCSLPYYTFWAASKGKQFSFRDAMLFPCLTTFTGISLLGLFFTGFCTPVSLLHGGAHAMLISGYFALRANSLMKGFNYDEHLPATVNMYSVVVRELLKPLKSLQRILENK